MFKMILRRWFWNKRASGAQCLIDRVVGSKGANCKPRSAEQEENGFYGKVRMAMGSRGVESAVQHRLNGSKVRCSKTSSAYRVRKDRILKGPVRACMSCAGMIGRPSA